MHVHPCMCTYACAPRYGCTYACAPTHVHLCMCTYAYAPMHVHLCMCTHACAPMHVHLCMCTYSHCHAYSLARMRSLSHSPACTSRIREPLIRFLSLDSGSPHVSLARMATVAPDEHALAWVVHYPKTSRMEVGH